MRFLPHPNGLCERGREWISLRLDGELAELAQKMLDSHLARCPECRAFEAEAAATTRLVRATPLELLAQPISLPRGRRLALSMRRVSAVAASAAAVVVGIGAFLNLPSASSTAAGPRVTIVTSDNSDLTQARGVRAALFRPDAKRLLPTRGPQ